MTLPTVSLRNHLLIAMPYMKDAQFAGTVTYLCDHGEQGAMGLIINRPMDFSLGDILVQLDIEAPQCRQPVLQGGPVQPERGFVLHRPVGDWQSSLKISDRLALTTSRDVLEAIAEDEGPSEFLITLGYAGWGAGQLEQELVSNFWLTCPADEAILFETPPEARFSAALARLGIDLNQLTSSVGHA